MLVTHRKFYSELFLINHSFMSDSLFKHLTLEDCKPLFWVRQVVSMGCQPQRPASGCQAHSVLYQGPIPELM